MISVISYFHNQEKAYEEWCKENKDGFVFNRAGGKTGNVLHHVGCWHLTVPSRLGTYTRYPKYCSTDLIELRQKADEVSLPNSWRKCSVCRNGKLA